MGSWWAPRLQRFSPNCTTPSDGKKHHSSAHPCNARVTAEMGKSFIADVWFSTYKEGGAHKLAAIIADVTEETDEASHAPASEHNERTALNNREIEVLRLLVQGLANKEIAAQMEESRKSTVKEHAATIIRKNQRPHARSTGSRRARKLQGRVVGARWAHPRWS